MPRLLIIFITVLLTAATAADAAKPRKKTRASASAPAATTQSVKRQKQENARVIKETSNKIAINTKETARQLNNLNLLAAEIKETDATIGSISHSVDSIDRAIATLNDSIATLNAKVAALKSKYASALRLTQGRRAKMSPLAFIFSAESFQQAYRRIRYLQQFSRWRQRRTAQITDAQRQLDQRRAALAQLHNSRQRSLNDLNTARDALATKRRDTDNLVASLKKEGGALKSLLSQKENEARQLDDQLNRMIAEEQRRREQQLAEQRRREEQARQARLAEQRRQQQLAEQRRRDEEARAAAEKQKADEARAAEQAAKNKPAKPAPAPQPAPQPQPAEKPRQEKPEKSKPAKPVKPKKHDKRDKNREQPQPAPQPAPAPQPLPSGDMAMGNRPSEADRAAQAEMKLSGDFESNRGRLPYPVAGRYRVVKHFGRQRHPELRYVETDNSGIDIETSSGAAARAIFPGKVSAIFRQQGFNTIVMVRHGSYLTIYAGLGAISVKTGDNLKAGQTIGTVYADPDDGGRSLLHFEIRKEKTKLNPEEWLR